jgi:hypothetical protein
VGGAGFDGTIEVVRGRLRDDRAAQIRDFWTDLGLGEEEASRRLPEVVCVALDRAGTLVGVNSVFAAEVPLVGDRSFWVYRSALTPDAAGADAQMTNAAFEALAEGFDPAEAGPVGVCVPVAGAEELARRPEAVWPETELMYAGYRRGDGAQIRIRYFEGARIGPGLPNSPTLEECRAMEIPVEDRYRLAPWDEAAAEIPGDRVTEFWLREAAIPEEEARRRVEEVHLLALDADDSIAGVSSAYLKRVGQLRMEMWHYRAFVGKDHRMSSLAVNLAVHGREVLEERFVTGRDTRAPGIVYEVENEGLKKYFNLALWLPTDFTFIGENQRGDHVRVHWFPGAEVPGPGAAARGDSL